MGAGVVMQYALDHPVLSLTLESPISPYGFGGTRRDGSRLTDDDAGSGGGTREPRLRAAADRPRQDATRRRPRRATSSASRYVAPGYTTEHEDVWVESMLTTSTATGNYPGDSVDTENWPGMAPGTIGVLNTMAPKYFNVSGIVDLAAKPPILWIHGTLDAIVSDTSFYDFNYLGQLGIVPGWPGDEVAPPRRWCRRCAMCSTRTPPRGGEVTEVASRASATLRTSSAPPSSATRCSMVIGYVGHPHDPAPPTETIILRSAD